MVPENFNIVPEMSKERCPKVPSVILRYTKIIGLNMQNNLYIGGNCRTSIDLDIIIARVKFNARNDNHDQQVYSVLFQVSLSNAFWVGI